MDLPKFDETFIPILIILNDGQVKPSRELVNQVRDRYYADLPEELLKTKTKSGSLVIFDRISWGKSYLKLGKFLSQPKYALVQITEKGRAALKKGSLTLDELRHDSDFVSSNAQKVGNDASRDTAINIHNASPQDLIDRGMASIESQVKNDLLDRLKILTHSISKRLFYSY